MLAAAAAAMARPAGAGAADLVPLRVAFDPIDSTCNFLTAQAQGYFAAQGLAVERVELPNGPAGAAALIAGSLELSNVNIASLVAARNKKLPFSIVAMGEMYTSAAPTTQLLVLRTSPLASAREIEGKTIAVNTINGLAYIATRDWMAKAGADPTTVRFLEMPFAAMPDALSTGRVDAIGVTEPRLSIAKRRDARVLASVYDAINPSFLIGACVATDDWIAKNAEVAHRFSLAVHQASIWANHNRDRTAEIVAAATGVGIDDIRSMTRATFPENQHGVALVQPVIEAVARFGAGADVGSAAGFFAGPAID